MIFFGKKTRFLFFQPAQPSLLNNGCGIMDYDVNNMNVIKAVAVFLIVQGFI